MLVFELAQTRQDGGGVREARECKGRLLVEALDAVGRQAVGRTQWQRVGELGVRHIDLEARDDAGQQGHTSSEERAQLLDLERLVSLQLAPQRLEEGSAREVRWSDAHEINVAAR